MGGANIKNDQNLVDYSDPRGAKPVGADAKIPVGRVDTQGNVILTPEQRKEDEAAAKVERKVVEPVATKNLDTQRPVDTNPFGRTFLVPNDKTLETARFGRDVSKRTLQSEEDIQQGLGK